MPQLLGADEELLQTIHLIEASILAMADDETSEELPSQGVSFDLDTILLYAYLVDALLVPEEIRLIGSSLSGSRWRTSERYPPGAPVFHH